MVLAEGKLGFCSVLWILSPALGDPQECKRTAARGRFLISCMDRRRDWAFKVDDSDNRGYLRNAYRVLLTRARQGVVIFVPPGSSKDPTRRAEFYHSTFNYPRELGIPSL